MAAYCFVLSADGDGKQASCSRESTPLHADWPPASLFISPQQCDQSQDGHLPRDPPLPGVDTFLATTDAERFTASCLRDSDKQLTAKDDVKMFEDTELTLAGGLPVPDNVFADAQSLRFAAARETITLNVEQQSVPTVIDDVSKSSDFASQSVWNQPSQGQLDVTLRRRDEATASDTQQPASGVSVSSAGVARLPTNDSDVRQVVRSHVVECSTSHITDVQSLSHPESILISDQFVTSGTAFYHFVSISLQAKVPLIMNRRV